MIRACPGNNGLTLRGAMIVRDMPPSMAAMIGGSHTGKRPSFPEISVPMSASFIAGVSDVRITSGGNARRRKTISTRHNQSDDEEVRPEYVACHDCAPGQQTRLRVYCV